MKRYLKFAVFLLIPFAVVNAAVPLEGFSEVVEKVSPSVVGITVTKMVEGNFSFNYDFDDEGMPDELRRFFKYWGFDGTPEPEVPPEYSVPGVGSGVLYDTKGHIVTNNHVVEDADEITVKLADGTEYTDVEIVGRDPETDLAVIKIKPKGSIEYAKFADSDSVKVGDWAIAIGNPYNLEHTLTVGVVSAKGRSNINLAEGPAYQDFIQTDAAINPGNSGGPLCNIAGEVIGINSAIRTSGLANSGIGFAIPSTMTKSIVDQLIEKGKISRGYIGIYLQEATPDLLEAMGAKGKKGVIAREVIDGTPADKAGLEDGDIITSFAGEEIATVDELRWLAASKKPGTTVDISIIRNGKSKRISLKLDERPDPEEMTGTETYPEKEPEVTKEFVIGVKIRDLTDEEKRMADVKSGVYVKDVEPGSLAYEVGIQPGDIIEKVNKNTISDVSDMKRLKGNLEKADVIMFQINRRGHTHFLTIRP
ncbi:Do family serine endopeptidase [candidate division WOR-3 bacterium]|uniref:Do family serine endopeptidase n=1 Tax=candidate division WOR-3 bacterium TaxID=2052148 RepID=A0A9D5KAM4_UNCW3|nr:Do family serine endopeptidase [candidate division WOR-3 bacterium]MBD3364699.1 Do family serine endopeptidase [candidate division WOR-3 bacterium]